MSHENKIHAIIIKLCIYEYKVAKLGDLFSVKVKISRRARNKHESMDRVTFNAPHLIYHSSFQTVYRNIN